MNSAQTIEAFLNALWLEFGLSDNTLSAYGSDLKLFAKWLKDKDITAVDDTTIKSFFG